MTVHRNGWALMNARHARREAWLNEHEPAARPFSVQLGEGLGWGLVHRDPCRPGGWRLTRFEGTSPAPGVVRLGEPYGHTELDSWRAAATEALRWWAGRLDTVVWR